MSDSLGPIRPIDRGAGDGQRHRTGGGLPQEGKQAKKRPKEPVAQQDDKNLAPEQKNTPDEDDPRGHHLDIKV